MQRNRTDVVEAALGILDEYGLADLTMRRLAGALGLQPGALYWHFPNKQAVLGAVSDAIVAPVAPRGSSDADTDGSWEEATLRVAHRLRDALLSRRDGAETVAASVSARTMATSLREILTAPIRRSGLPDEHAAIAADSLLFYILGSASDEQARMQLDSAGALADDHTAVAHEPSPTERFAFGLRLFVDGVAARTGTAASSVE